MPGRESEAKTAVAKLVELYPGFTIETFYEVIRSFNFTEPYMELAADGLRKAGLDIPTSWLLATKRPIKSFGEKRGDCLLAEVGRRSQRAAAAFGCAHGAQARVREPYW